ncbi:hypothetical protein SAMN02745146_0766 [Hymenobacter daecheongensis DSM 21074]|uniref:SpoIIAA-like n=1 Tax=Hymenobacter daecheongensis DSM 21074 TaxID=1121955 RepID=A0A1M6AU74_9BACT|nr:hypothetical protein [Hymenobacter daecheongensis]SHI39977.1 hypothetical protein SAMN02745146_0766 [Hymenobacter daecheongensis DSM 21074]
MDNRYHSDFLDVAYRADLRVVVGRWMRQATLEELKQGYQRLLEVAFEPACRGWLLDTRRRLNTDPAAQRWLTEGFMDTAAARLGGRVYMAYLLPPAQLRDTTADSAFPPPQFFANKPYEAARFTDERQAVEWLLHCQNTAPAAVR